MHAEAIWRGVAAILIFSSCLAGISTLKMEVICSSERQALSEVQGDTPHKTVLFIVTAVGKSNAP
jgi:hypothetical protein